MVTDSLRVTYIYDVEAWALIHGSNLMNVGDKPFYERRDELVKVIVDGGFSVDHFGYIH